MAKVGKHYLTTLLIEIETKNICRVKITLDDPSSDPEIEEDDAELILEKLEEEMMADYEEEDEDVLHVDDIVKLYTESNAVGLQKFLLNIL